MCKSDSYQICCHPKHSMDFIRDMLTVGFYSARALTITSKYHLSPLLKYLHLLKITERTFYLNTKYWSTFLFSLCLLSKVIDLLVLLLLSHSLCPSNLLVSKYITIIILLQLCGIIFLKFRMLFPDDSITDSISVSIMLFCILLILIIKVKHISP